jgi:hypothetical protein
VRILIRKSACFLLPAFLFLGIFLHFPLHAQFREGPAGPERFALHLSETAGQVFDWYDAPIFLAYLYNRYEIFSPEGRPFVIETGPAEQQLARSVAGDGADSPGSIDPFTIPHIIIGARLLHAAGKELFTDADMRNEMRGTLGLYKSLMYTQVITQMAKNVVHRTRPDGSDAKSFFSGHTSTTFAAAAFLQREADHIITNWDALDNSDLLRNALRAGAASVLYGWAGYVGYSRMYDGKHYLSDVVVGALIGTLIGNFVYEQVNDSESSIMPSLGAGAGEEGPWIALQVQF